MSQCRFGQDGDVDADVPAVARDAAAEDDAEGVVVVGEMHGGAESYLADHGVDRATFDTLRYLILS